MPYPIEYAATHGEWVKITGTPGQVAIPEAPNYALRYPEAPYDFQLANHSGVDTAHPTNPNCPIYAIEDGIVVETSEDDGTQNGHFLWGLTAGVAASIKVDSIKQLEVVYSQEHFSSRFVRVGDRVTRGMLLGFQGSTGYSTGPHCHSKLHVNGKLRDIFPFVVGDPSTLLRIKDVFADPVEEETAMPGSHTIARGDTLWALAATYGTTVDALRAANPGVDPNALQIGSVILIPSDTAPTENPLTVISGLEAQVATLRGERDYKQNQLQTLKAKLLDLYNSI